MGYRSIILIGVIWFILDRVSKLWAASPNFRPIVWVEKIFYLNLHHNQGIAFGLQMPFWLQVIISILLIGFLIYLLLNPYNLIPAYPARPSESFERANRLNPKKIFIMPFVFGIILGGAFGNFFDRLSHGFVVDFIVLKPFPVFNLADVGITVGLVFLVVMSFKKT